MSEAVRIGSRAVGDGQPVFVVAEIGLNHNGDPALAAELVRAAAGTGVDGVKLQRRHPKVLLTRALYDSPYQGENSYGATYGEHREALELPLEEWVRLRDLAASLGLVFFASAWDIPSVADCEDLGLELFKVASADVTNIPLLEAVAATQKPVIVSTGMSTEEEVALAVETIRRWHDRLVLLHCVSSYPAEFDEVNLRTIPWLRDRFGCPVGYSGHERGIAVSAAAVSLDACMIERHFTLDRTMKGPDHAASLEPPGLGKLVRDIRAVEQALGVPSRHVTERELPTRRKLAKSLVAVGPLSAGHTLAATDLIAKSPSAGLSPADAAQLVGRELARDVAADEYLTSDDLVPR